MEPMKKRWEDMNEEELLKLREDVKKEAKLFALYVLVRTEIEEFKKLYLADLEEYVTLDDILKAATAKPCVDVWRWITEG